ncbi:MAG: ATP-binding protein [Deltaproteobacteria bacterium]|nr:ATP-binding protein [Deltaproteobacteria bacterium]
MARTDFKARAVQESLRYGQDPWVFLRELAQNARDAKAGQISVLAGVEAGEEWLSFEDDGHGMDFAHARAYLFRLYASSKENEPDAAGCFGVGFWSVLRFNPTLIEVESRSRGAPWGVRLSASLDHVEVIPCRMKTVGTRVTLRRPVAGDGKRFAADVGLALRRHCRYLRRAGRPLEPLWVRVNGKCVNEELVAPGVASLSFRTRDAEGAVGLAELPKVELYASGLLVMTATVLEELEASPSVPVYQRLAGGLAPAIILNSNRLDLVMSRSRPVASQALRRLTRVARSQLARLVGELSRAARPETPWETVKRFSAAFRAAALRVAAGVAAGLAVAMAVAVVVVGYPRPPSPAAADALPGGGDSSPVDFGGGSAPVSELLPYTNLNGYEGATVEVPDPRVGAWDLTYDGPKEILFAALVLSRYDRVHGFVRGVSGPARAYPAHRCDRHCVRVWLTVVPGAEPLVVPVPTGHRLVRASVRFDGKMVDGLQINDFDEPLVQLPKGDAGVLEYVTGAFVAGPEPRVVPPAVQLPEDLRRAVAESAGSSRRQRAGRLTRFVRRFLTYDVSPQMAARYATDNADWLSRVSEAGAGDCDVKNGVNVLLLQSAGIPARMVLGIAAKDGHARPQLHAWTEYYDAGWHAVDATGAPPPAAPLPPATAAPPLSSQSAAQGDLRAASAAVPAPAAPAPPPEAPPQPTPAVASPAAVLALEAETGKAWPLRLGVFCGLVAVAALFSWWRRGAWRGRFVARGGQTEAESALARLLKDAVLHPEVWSKIADVWQRPALPTLLGPPMSLADTMARAAAATLYLSRRHSELALLAARRKTPVLDAAHVAFKEVMDVLGRAIDLDGIDRVRPAARTAADAERADLALAPVNALLRDVVPGVRCLACAGLETVATLDVDLSGVRLPAGAPWPKRYVAVHWRHPEVQDRLALLASDPARGLFVFLDWLLDRSPLLAVGAERLRARAAWTVFGGGR